MAALNRLNREFRRINEDAIINIDLRDDNLLTWFATLIAQDNTRFSGQKFIAEISFPTSYPFNPPTLRFLTPVNHISVDRHGNVCMDILKDAWSPALTAEMVLISALSILNDSDERILDDVKEEISELRVKTDSKNKRLLRQKLKEHKIKSEHIVECQQGT